MSIRDLPVFTSRITSACRHTQRLRRALGTEISCLPDTQFINQTISQLQGSTSYLAPPWSDFSDSLTLLYEILGNLTHMSWPFGLHICFLLILNSQACDAFVGFTLICSLSAHIDLKFESGLYWNGPNPIQMKYCRHCWCSCCAAEPWKLTLTSFIRGQYWGCSFFSKLWAIPGSLSSSCQMEKSISFEDVVTAGWHSSWFFYCPNLSPHPQMLCSLLLVNLSDLIGWRSKLKISDWQPCFKTSDSA